jgi:hypothetical protein
MTAGIPATRAAKQATSTIPIVVGGAADLVGTGLVATCVRCAGADYLMASGLMGEPTAPVMGSGGATNWKQ